MPIGDGVQSTNQAKHRYVEQGVTVGFFTDATLCIGCKACEVACKEWNDVPDDGYVWTGDSYDNTGALGASTWRHVKFVEQPLGLGGQVAGPMTEGGSEDPFRWVFLSDVCRHCEVAGCLEVCPTGAIVRTETGGVFVQDDVCNGCGYCTVACPFGVIERRGRPGQATAGVQAMHGARPTAGAQPLAGAPATHGARPTPGARPTYGAQPPHGAQLASPLPSTGGAFKCTFCYDRQKSGLAPACAKACPTESIQFGPLEELRERAKRRLDVLAERGYTDVVLYDPVATSVGGIHAFFLVPGDPAAFGLPATPEAPVAFLVSSWASALVTSVALLAVALAAFLWA